MESDQPRPLPARITRVFRRLGRGILLVVVTLSAATLGVCGLENRWRDLALEEEAAQDRQKTPFYLWSTYTGRGAHIGFRHGSLKLMLSPQVGYRNWPDQDTGRFTTDRRGYRGPFARSSGDEIRIVVVGGSTAFATGADSDDVTYAAQLMRLRPELSVINAAVIGHRSGNELSMLVNELIDLEPMVVVSLGGWNDYYQAMRGKPMWPWNIGFAGYGQVERQLEYRARQTSPHALERLAEVPRVLFPRVMGRVMRRYSSGPVSSSHWQPAADPRKVTVQDVARQYVLNVHKMQRITAAFGGRFLCALQPMRAHVDPLATQDDLASGYREFRRMTRDEFERRGIGFADLNEPEAGFRPEMFTDEVHLNEPGNSALARYLLRQFVIRGWLPAS